MSQFPQIPANAKVWRDDGAGREGWYTITSTGVWLYTKASKRAKTKSQRCKDEQEANRLLDQFFENF